ncbi:MAG: hypothetical protein JWN38_517 [Candidatus Saccharibacteria bacterium]|nr:hypothetical protein [Candidatus Saccharibacteria bacterium]
MQNAPALIIIVDTMSHDEMTIILTRLDTITGSIDDIKSDLATVTVDLATVKADLKTTNTHIDAVNDRTDVQSFAINARFDEQEGRFAKLERSISHIYSILDSLRKRQESSEQEQLIANNELKKLNGWAHTLSRNLAFD